MKKPIPFGKYLLLDRINVGGMAEVFVAKSFGAEGFERILAIKKILPTMVEDQEFITMFIDEARIAVQLNHANIVQIYELGKHDENYYIAMEYVSGKDLRVLLDGFKKQKSIMPTPMAVFIASKICEGIDYAHRKKSPRGQELHIVHRDVSPQNILLSFDGEVKIIDFGIAKAANRAQKTQAGILKGKFGYMSPEQVRGLPIDRRSDIFAVGVILYELLTGEKLFVGESDFSTLEKVRNAEVLPPSKYNEDIPEGLEKVVLKALARDVEDRYQWASDLQEDLMRFLLAGDSIFSVKSLVRFMRETYADDVTRESERMERFGKIDKPEGVLEPSVVTATVTPTGAQPKKGEVTADLPMPEPTSNERTQIFAMSFEKTEASARAEDTGPNLNPPGAGESASTVLTGTPDETSPAKAPDRDRQFERMDASLSANSASNKKNGGGLLPEIPSEPSVKVTEEKTMIKAENASAPNVSGSIRRSSGKIERPNGRGSLANARPTPPPPKARLEGEDRTGSTMRGAAGKEKVASGKQNDFVAWVKQRKALAVVAIMSFGVIVGVAVALAIGGGKTKPPKDEPVAASGGSGTLFVAPNPPDGVTVEIDGVVVQHDDSYLGKVPAGRHKVVGRWEGAAPVEQWVDIETGMTLTLKIGRDAKGKAGGRELAAGGDAPPPLGAEGDKPGTEPGTRPGPDKGSGKPPPERPQRVSALFDSVPEGAALYIDNKKVGTTPYSFDAEPSDRVYKLRFEHKNFQVAERAWRTADSPSMTVSLAELGPGEVGNDATPPPPKHAKKNPPKPPKVVKVAEADPAPPPEPAEPAPPKPPKVAKAEPKPPKPAPAGPAAQGKLIANTNPISHVFVDGKDTGRTTPVPPTNPLVLSVGDHTVEFRADNGKKETRKVTIAADKLEKLVGISLQ